jgi:hypothetical protein
MARSRPADGSVPKGSAGVARRDDQILLGDPESAVVSATMGYKP